MPSINADANTGGKRRLLWIHFHDVANAPGRTFGFRFLRFRQNESKFVSAVACCGVNRTAVNAEDIGNAAQRAASNKMAVRVVDFFEAVEIKKKDREWSIAAIGALGFTL